MMGGHELHPTMKTMMSNLTLSNDEIIKPQVFKLVVILNSGVG